SPVKISKDHFAACRNRPKSADGTVSTTNFSFCPRYSPLNSKHPGVGKSTPVSIVHPPSDAAFAFVGRETTAIAGAPVSSFTVTFRFDSMPGLKPALRQNIFTAIRAPGAVVGMSPSGERCTASALLPYQCGASLTVRGQVKSALADIGPRRHAMGISAVSTVFMSLSCGWRGQLTPGDLGCRWA